MLAQAGWIHARGLWRANEGKSLSLEVFMLEQKVRGDTSAGSEQPGLQASVWERLVEATEAEV